MTDLYTEILADAPLAYWNLGATGDASGNARSLTAGVAPTYLQAQLLPASALFSTKYVASSSSYLYRAHQSWMNVADTFTIEFVLGFASRSGGAQYVISKGTGSYAVRLVDHGSGSVSVELYKHGTGRVAYATVSVFFTRHVVITKSGSTRKIYVDGVDMTTLGTNQTMTNTSTQLEVGRHPGGSGSEFLNSYISDIAVYDYAMTAARAQVHYWSTRAQVAIAVDDAGMTFSQSSSVIRRQPMASSQEYTMSQYSVIARRQSVAVEQQDYTATVDGVVVRRHLPAVESVDSLVTTDVLNTLLRRGIIASMGGGLSLTGDAKPHPYIVGIFVGAASLSMGLLIVAGRELAAIPIVPPAQPPTVVTAGAASERLVESLQRSHRVELLARVLNPATGEPMLELTTITKGSVTLDASSNVRGRLELELVTTGDLVPRSPTDALAPYGNEIQVARGVRFPDGTAEVVSLGVFRIRQVDVQDSGEQLLVRLVALDRWSRFVDARFEQLTTIGAGANIRNTIVDVATAAWPGVPYELPPAPEVLPATGLIVERGSDRGELLRALATSSGRELYFDDTGTLISTPIATTSGVADNVLRDGTGGLLLDITSEWDSERVYNKVIASGESMDDQPPVSGVALDDNPASPTYYDGPFGRRPRFYVSSMITTSAQAVDAARGILSSALGTSQRVSFGAVVNPTIRPGTMVRVERERTGIVENHVVDSITIPLSAEDTMSGTTRLVEVLGE